MKQKLSRRSALAFLGVSVMVAACGGTNTSTSTSTTTAAKTGAPGGQGGPGVPSNTTSTSSVKVNGSYTLNGGKASLSNKVYTVSKNDISAILVSNSGNLTMTNVTVNTTGNSSSSDNSSFYGQNAPVLATSGSTLTMTGCNVASSGSGANGVYSTGTSTKITISNSTIKATGDFAHGIMATQGGTLIAQNVNITTTQSHGAAIATDRGGGTVTVTGGTMKTSGSGSPSIYSTGTITVTDATMVSTGAEAAVVEGSNTVKVINSSMVTRGSRGVMLYQSFSGDAQGTSSTFTMSGGSLSAANGPLFYITNATGVINLTGAKLTAASGTLINAAHNDQWGTQGSNGGTAVLNATGQTLTGNVLADSLSSVTIALQKGSSLTGSINTANTAKAANLTLDGTSKWNVTGNSYLNTIAISSGISGSSITNIIGNGHTVYYNASANSTLGGKTYSLVNGGTLAPK